MERSVYRIIDANFNRAREALRVVEEYCRFTLNSSVLTERCKQLRHRLSSEIGKLEISRLLTSRDTLSDVGVGRKVTGQLERGDLKDCTIAACKRLTEALRALSEMTGIEKPTLAQKIEEMRFTAYTLEKDVVLFSSPAQKFSRVSLYVIISSSLAADVISLAHCCAANGADCIQLRAKQIDDDSIFALAVELVQICRDAGILSIINDRIDIAVAAGADGVHLGQHDLSVQQARNLQLAPIIVGKSTHCLSELRTACEELPTYISLGPIFATPTKPSLDSVGLDYVANGLKELANSGIGHVAIGGITPGNIQQVLSAGARAVAVCSAVASARDPAAVCRELKDKIINFRHG